MDSAPKFWSQRGGIWSMCDAEPEFLHHGNHTRLLPWGSGLTEDSFMVFANFCHVSHFQHQGCKYSFGNV